MVVSSPNMHALLATLCAFALAGNALAETLQPRLAKYVTSADGTRIYAEAQGNVSAPPSVYNLCSILRSLNSIVSSHLRSWHYRIWSCIRRPVQPRRPAESCVPGE
jgi:hypothetical protein